MKLLRQRLHALAPEIEEVQVDGPKRLRSLPCRHFVRGDVTCGRRRQAPERVERVVDLVSNALVGLSSGVLVGGMMICAFCAADNADTSENCFRCGKGLFSLTQGQVIAGRYEILRPLGKGGMGIVYKARDRELDETVALKVIRQEVADSSEAAQRFRLEIKLARRVSHRNVCRIHEYGREGHLSYIVMEFVEGVDLKQIIRQGGRLLPPQAFETAIQIAEALQAIHDQGIVHRDLKAQNVMRDARGAVKLMDFGIAKSLERGAEGPTATGHVVGTPEYMSPEQARGEQLDERSDIYALGVMIFELFTGDVPFHGQTPVATLFKQIKDPPPLDGPAAALLPPALIPILRKALAKSREERFASAREVARALGEARARSLGGAPLGRPAEIANEPVGTETRSRVVPAPVEAQASTAPGGAPTVPGVTGTTEVPASAPASTPKVRVSEAHALLERKGGRATVWIGAGLGTAVVVAAFLVPSARQTPPGPLPPTPAGGAPQQSPPGTPRSTASAAAPQPAVTNPPARATELPSRASPQSQPHPPTAAAVGPPARPDPLVEGLLAEAEGAFTSRQYTIALGFYGEVLAKDPGNARASVGKELCLQAMAHASAEPLPGKAFVEATTARAGPQPASAPRGFEESAGVATRRVAEPPPLPGAIHFEVTPRSVTPGDDFRLTVYLVNESFSILQLRDVQVTTTVNGRSASGPVVPKIVALGPRQKAVLLDFQDRWKADATSWSMTVTVSTRAGESFKNEIAWK